MRTVLAVAAAWLILSALAGMVWWAVSAGMRRAELREHRRRGAVPAELSRAVLYAAEVADREARRLLSSHRDTGGDAGAEARALRLEADALHREWARLESRARSAPPG